ncbi:hypothetical protein PVK06_027028 [Gossypium arboreum]|uniref:Uncharacterized protein n=1 Tax=Gossypium arboreum TaxID=29729 RepID=A0ABR0NZB4_GOSAR|nr:hypothetical protein PVK06_027028 [Gossypium arboreum]
MELVDDDDVETMVTLYCQDQSCQTYLIQLFTMLVYVEPAEVVIDTDADGDDVYDKNGSSNHEVEAFSDPNENEVSNEICDEGTNDNGNVNAPLVGNPN